MTRTRSGRSGADEEAGPSSAPAPKVTEFFAVKSDGSEQSGSKVPFADAELKALEKKAESIKDTLRKRRARTNENGANGAQDGEEYEQLLKESDKIGTVRKERVFEEAVTEEDLAIIKQRIELQQKQFAEYEKRQERRKYAKVSAAYNFLNEEEIRYMLTECEDDEDMVLGRLSDPRLGFLAMIRKRIAQDHMQTQSHTRHLTKEQQEEYDALVAKRKSTVKKTTSAESKEKTRKYQSVKRLRLNDAIKKLNDGSVSLEEAMKDWSSARIRAYRLIKENPNAYYYRFNDPGEMQRNGQWSKEEHNLFMKRLAEIGADGQWGVFAMAIPGRVGYQCSNYYRTLILSGQVQDPNYVIDDKGKCHYLFSTKKPGGAKEIRTFSRKKGSDDDDDDDGTPKRRSSTGSRSRSGKKKRRRGSDDDSDEDDNLDETGTWKPKRSFYTTKRCRILKGELVDADEEVPNPLPGRIDPITLDEVVRPAISPYGHVMSYSSWVQCLEESNVCPLTKKPLQKKDLVLLTPSNIDEFRDKIVD